MLTPFSANTESVDFDSMRREVEFVLSAGVSGVVACGKAGEFEGMSAGMTLVIMCMRAAVVHVGITWARPRRLALCISLIRHKGGFVFGFATFRVSVPVAASTPSPGVAHSTEGTTFSRDS